MARWEQEMWLEELRLFLEQREKNGAAPSRRDLR